MTFDLVTIIYNPKSTGDGYKNAKNLRDELKVKLPQLKVRLEGTKYAGHAEELAYNLSKASKSPLIVSASGDGGYNEVVNGAMRAQTQGAQPICAVLASGNANDHSRTLQSKPLLESIISGKVTSIDLLKITTKKGSSTSQRYAHSYIGLGLTPVVAVELNKTDLNALKEMMIVIKTFYKYRPFKIKHNGKLISLDSMIFANIGEMAKVLTVSKNSRPDDGFFELILFRHNHKRRLLSRLLRATVSGLEPTKKYKSYDFTIGNNTPVQLDGEVIKIENNSKVRVTSEHKMLKTII